MSYYPAPDAPDAAAMLKEMGISDVADLFTSIPQPLRDSATINLPAGISEQELVRRFRKLAAKNRPLTETASFVGAGSYAYPPVAAALYAMQRGEFLTAYTPYQPEISQGTLMAIFEFQTWIAELTGLDVANASMYDGASAMAEAILMGLRVRRKCRQVFLSAGLHPTVQSVIRRYLAGQHEVSLEILPLTDSGQTDLSAAISAEGVKIVALGCPNGMGIVEDISAARAGLDEKDFLVVHTPDPHAWLILNPPGAQGADVVVGEGQPFGVPPSYGGPALGVFATRKAYVRQMPGRLCGQTVDADGRPGYVLTLSTREQHIRRDKATSNICTNQGVIALLATVSMGVLGPAGLRERAVTASHNARRLETLLTGAGFKRRHSGPWFNECVMEHPDAAAMFATLVEHGVQIGVPLSTWDPGDTTGLLVCATAWQGDDDFDRLQEALNHV